jgi:hypothetical protein
MACVCVAKATLAILIPELKKLREDSDAIKKEEVQTLAVSIRSSNLISSFLINSVLSI